MTTSDSRPPPPPDDPFAVRSLDVTVRSPREWTVEGARSL